MLTQGLLKYDLEVAQLVSTTISGCLCCALSTVFGTTLNNTDAISLAKYPAKRCSSRTTPSVSTAAQRSTGRRGRRQLAGLQVANYYTIRFVLHIRNTLFSVVFRIFQPKSNRKQIQILRYRRIFIILGNLLFVPL